MAGGVVLGVDDFLSPDATTRRRELKCSIFVDIILMSFRVLQEVASVSLVEHCVG